MPRRSPASEPAPPLCLTPLLPQVTRKRSDAFKAGDYDQYLCCPAGHPQAQ